jgi:hypothetical protein
LVKLFDLSSFSTLGSITGMRGRYDVPAGLLPLDPRS